MLRILAAATLAIALPLTAFAQDSGMDQLKAQIMDDPATMGLEIDMDSLTDEQVTEIVGVLDSNDDENMKKDKIRAILGQ